MSNVFEVKDVDVFYGETQAIKTVSIDIPEHSVTAFIGPSGCGKSTLLRCFNRMNDLIPNCKVGGQILYRGQDIAKMDEIDLRVKVGMVFQSPNPFPMSIYDNIAYGPRCQGIRKKEILDKIVIQSLQKAALYDEVANRLHEGGLALSGGQQQRLCIARAIAMEPDVILMDEPTSALDPISTLKIEELIFTLKEEYTIIIVTHNMQQAARVSDNTAFFLTGEIVEAGRTDQIFKNPTMKKTEDYITGRFG